MRFRSEAVRAVLLDVDGTLRDTDDELVERLDRVTARLLGAGRAGRLSRRFVMGLEGPVQHLFAQADRLGVDGALHRVVERVMPGGHGTTRVCPGVFEAVTLLRGRVRLAVVSAGPKRVVEAFLAEHDLAREMDLVVSGLTCRRTKPHPEPILWAARQLGLQPAQVVMIGDTTVDIRSGRAAGAQTVGVLTGFGHRDELERAGADLVVDRLDDAARVLLR